MGNRTVQTRTITATLVTTYTYDAANRLINAGDVAYTWNANPTPLRFGDFAAT
jgi:YD repeat-containing protein